MKAGDRRYTVEVLAAGQARAYADTIHHVRVTFEWVPYSGELSWQPAPVENEQWVRDTLRSLSCGFTDFVKPTDGTATMDDEYRTRLDWLKMTGIGVWEFHTTSRYTD